MVVDSSPCYLRLVVQELASVLLFRFPLWSKLVFEATIRVHFLDLVLVTHYCICKPCLQFTGLKIPKIRESDFLTKQLGD